MSANEMPPGPQAEPLVVPSYSRPRKKKPNMGLLVLGAVGVIGLAGVGAIMAFSGGLMPAEVVPQGTPSMAHAEACLREGNVLCAQADYIAYLKVYPEDRRANALLAILLTEDGRHRQALKYYRKALELGAATYDLRAKYAKSLEATGDLDAAIRENYAALDIVPSLVDVRGDLADQLVRKGRRQEAIDLLTAFDQTLEDRGHAPRFAEKIAGLQRGGPATAPATMDAAAQAAARARLAPGEGTGKGITRIPLTPGQGVHYVPVKLNGVIDANFAVDSGASTVVLSEDVFRRLIDSGTLSRRDHLGSGMAELADGSTVVADAYNIRSLQVGGRTIHNITAMVARGRRGQLLLGQSFLRRFKSWSIDNRAKVLELRD